MMIESARVIQTRLLVPKDSDVFILEFKKERKKRKSVLGSSRIKVS